MSLGMHQPIPGGSEYLIEYEAQARETITVYLPPVGYTIDRMPNPDTGIASFELIKCEILNEDVPIPEQKWKRPTLPKDWPKWMAEEERQNKFTKGWVHPEAEKFRAREWTRRINGVWMALGNRNNKPSEYVYMPPNSYLYFAWWKADFGYPKFRKIYIDLYYALQWADDNLLVHGIIFGTKRRFGKTAMAGCWTFDYPSRVISGYGAMQGQNAKKAVQFFDINLMQPFRKMIKFFKPLYDPMQSQQKQLVFLKPAPKSKKKSEEYEKELEFQEDDENEYLGGRITSVSSSESSLDGTKIHRFWADEPAKWEKVDVLDTISTYLPCTEDEMGNKIGLMFVPSTIEKFEKGGKEFTELAEKSFPSSMKASPTGKTESSLVLLFIPAYKAFVFDEYGRSIINDPAKGEIIYDEGGKLITEGSKTKLTKRRASKIKEEDKIKEIRKYPWNWLEAKLQNTTKCQFNRMILNNRIQELYSMPRMPWARGNFDWINGVEDGDVEFIRDDIAGRFQVAWLPDSSSGQFEDQSHAKVINNVDFEWDDGKKQWYPKNDRLFSAGCDPFKYKVKGVDPRLSKGALHIFRKYDPQVDAGKDFKNWESYNFIIQYLYRPDDWEIFGEDMIKVCRYFGVSIGAEDNISDLRQHFDKRGYGRFILYSRDIPEDVLKNTSPGTPQGYEKTLKSNDESINTYTKKLNTFFNRHGHRVMFPELLEQALSFDINNTTSSDCVVSAGWTLIASEKIDTGTGDEEALDIGGLFPMYDNSGVRSKLIT